MIFDNCAGVFTNKVQVLSRILSPITCVCVLCVYVWCVLLSSARIKTARLESYLFSGVFICQTIFDNEINQFSSIDHHVCDVETEHKLHKFNPHKDDLKERKKKNSNNVISFLKIEEIKKGREWVDEKRSKSAANFFKMISVTQKQRWHWHVHSEYVFWK